jgi:DNA-binding GntR family transcriptional regulator
MSMVGGTAHGSRGSDPVSATFRAYQHLKQQVLTCSIRPGSMIYEGEIAEALAMSKTPVREALGMLVKEGYVEVHPRRGYLVTHITLSDVKEIYHLRLLLEPAAARLASVNATDEQRERLRHLATGTADHDYAGRVRHAHLFHEMLAEASGSVRLAQTLVGVLEECQRLYFIGIDLDNLVDHAGDDHEALLDALEAGEADVAEQVARDQVDRSRAVVLDRIAQILTDPDPSVTPDAITIGRGPNG